MAVRIFFLIVGCLLLPGRGQAAITAQQGWQCYNDQNYECAERSFRTLHRLHPARAESLLGLCYSLQRLDKRAEALALLAEFSGEKSQEMEQLHLDLLQAEGLMLYESGQYTEAEGILAKVVRLDPANQGMEELLLWTRYHLGDSDGLLAFLRRQYRKTGDLKTASDLLVVLQARGDQDDIDAFISQLAGQEQPKAGHLVAQYYYQHIGPVTAAQFDPRDGSCYVNCDAVKLRGGPFYYYREGDDGFSKLDVFGVTVQAEATGKPGQIWNIRLSPLYLDAGSAGAAPYAGSYYRLIADPQMGQRSLVESRTVYDWQLRFDQEGTGNFDFSLGSTPVNGVVSVRPVFSLSYDAALWNVRLEQASVKESILSWIGQDDPYSRQSWGRVLKSGLRARKTFELEDHYWFSVEGTFHYYWGENIEDNQGGGVSASVGRTDAWYAFNRNIGLFADAISFKDNQSFYTYGHGGYYSPEMQVTFGPFIRLTTEKCRSRWLDMEFSVGYSWRKTEDAPHYRDPDLSGLDPSFVDHADITGFYEGEEDTDISVNVKLRGMQHLVDNWYVAGSASINNSSGYREIHVGGFLQYHFGATQGAALCDAARQIDLLMETIY